MRKNHRAYSRGNGFICRVRSVASATTAALLSLSLAASPVQVMAAEQQSETEVSAKSAPGKKARTAEDAAVEAAPGADGSEAAAQDVPTTDGVDAAADVGASADNQPGSEAGGAAGKGGSASAGGGEQKPAPEAEPDVSADAEDDASGEQVSEDGGTVIEMEEEPAAVEEETSEKAEQADGQPLECRYEDDSIVITATVKDSRALPDGAQFFCNPIDPSSDEYMSLLDDAAGFYGVAGNSLELYPYDVGFSVGGAEVEPESGVVEISFEFKKPIKVAGDENVDVLHMPDVSKVEVVAEGVEKNGQVKKVAVDLESLSPVVIAKTNAGGVKLMSSSSINSDGDEYFISKTPNIDDNGNKNTNYSHNMNTIDVVEVPGALSLDITIEYGGESTNWDWVCMWEGNHPNYSAYNNHSTSLTGKLGGNHGTMSYSVNGDTVTFGFRSDGSGVGDGYGYYAVITPNYPYPTTPVPAYHFEELEDGTYALVFDQAGDIESFVSRPEVSEAIAPYKGSISEIRLHKDMTSIGDHAFKGLTALKKVTFPRNGQIESIGKSAFAGCDNLENFSVPATVSSIASSAFRGCSSLSTFSFAPGNTMTELPAGLFKDLTALSDVTLPAGLTAIPENLFYGCTGLHDIELPSTVTKIGNNAFRNTRLYETPDLSNIVEIGSRAFSNNPELETVSIPASVTTLSDAFRECTGITDFTFEDGTSFPTLPADFFQGMTKLKTVKLPSDLTKISNEMFKGCSSLEHVDFPSTVTAIGDYAFADCTKLQDFEIPPGVKSIGGYAFSNCDSLKDMIIPNTVTSVGTYLFNDCGNLLRLRFEDGSPISSLPSGMFSNCTNLEQVKLPDGVSAIPASYFYGCKTLMNVELPDNLTSIGDNAFYGCKNLQDLSFPNTLKTIGTQAFYDCDSIENVSIPNSVTSIGSSAFYTCDHLESVVWAEGSPMTTLSESLFRACTSLKTLVLPENLTYIPRYLAYGCTSLEHVDIPSKVASIRDCAFESCSKLDGVALPESCTQIYQYAFRNSGLTHIEFPDSLQSIGQYAFYGTKIHNIELPGNVTSLSQYAFSNMPNLETVVFEEGGKNIKIQDYVFSNDPMLKTITTNGRDSLIAYGAFMNDRRLLEYTVGPNVTEVRAFAFDSDINMTKLEIAASPTGAALTVDTNGGGYAFGRLSSLQNLVVDRDLTSNYKNYTEFKDLNPYVHVTIGDNVDKLDNMLVSALSDTMDVTFEGENDFTVTTRLDNRSTDVKWSELKGSFYADSQGVLYKLDDTNHTASLFYVPDGITSYTVPSSITSVAGNEYSVTGVDSYIAKSADDLETLTFEDPSKVSILQFAFSKNTSLRTINGKNELYPEEWAEVSQLCDFPIHSDVNSEQVLHLSDTMSVGSGEDSGTFSFGVSISGQEKMDEENPLTYVYPTGRSARFDFAVSNESNADMSDRVIRVYFAFSGDNYTMGNYPPGDYSLVNTSTGSRYPFKVRATDAKGVYYYDITGFKPGDTLAFNNQMSYVSPTSGGGDLTVWVESISAAEAAEREGKTSQPNKYILANWYTQPTPYNLAKSAVSPSAFRFAANAEDENDDDIYVQNLSYSIKLTSSGSSSTSYAKDYIKYIDVEDELLLNENMVWNPDVIAAVNAGDYYYNFNGSYVYLYVKLGGKWVELCNFTTPNGTGCIRSVYPKVVSESDEDPKILLCWSYRNTYWTDTTTSPSADLPGTTFNLTIGKQSVEVKRGSDLWQMFREGREFTAEESAAMRQIANKVDETTHYSYSADQRATATTPQNLITMTSGFQMRKTSSGYTTFGREHAFDISLTNSGLAHKDDVDLVTDTLNIHYYITPEDMETMLDDARWGRFLTLDIASVTLCELPDKHGVDVYGNQIVINDAQYSGVDPIPYNGQAQAGSDASERVTNAKLCVRWNDGLTGKLLEVKDDAGVVQQSYSIGAGGDYETLEAALKAIGFIVTYRTEYKVTWNLDEPYTLYQARKDGVDADSLADLTDEQKLKYEYQLKSGRTDTFHIPSRIKRTDMFLVGDTPHYYTNSSIYSTNTAYVKDNTGKQVGSSSWTGYIYRDLSLDKSATVNGTTYTSNLKVPDDTVIDYRLSFSNSGANYEVLPLTDKMGGSQVLIVPVRSNRTALYHAVEGDAGVAFQDAGLDIYTSGGIQYYVLDKDGNYEGVVIDGRLTDTVKVSHGTGGIETLMIWYYQDVDGTTPAGAANRSITYKALADSSRLGMSAVGADGSTVTKNLLSNYSWLGGHQTHRLVASLYGESEMLQFSKNIVEDPNAQRENLINHSLVQDGDTVLYKMIVKNTGDAAATIKGGRLRDELPNTGGIFEWSKANVVDISYVTENLGSSVTTTGDEYWYVNSVEPLTGANTASRGKWYIRWTDDFQIDMEGKGEIWIYIKLKFPASTDPGASGGTSNVWDDYIAKNNGATLQNDFYIDERYSRVTHELVDVVEGTLQKGVLDTGLSTNGKFQSEDTRHYYQNGGNMDNGSVQEVAYYTVVYNSGNVRLYLDNLQDRLPKGFKFRGLFNRVPKSVETNKSINTSSSPWNYNDLGGYYNQFSIISNTENASSSSSMMPIATVSDEKRDAITYKSARITASAADASDGYQQVRFTIDNNNNSSYVSYDSDLGKYYLNPGEAIRFGYLCTVEGYARTENVANNEISMAAYDKYGLGVHESDEEQVQITPATYRDIARNDGTRDLTLTEDEVGGYGHVKPTWAKGTTNWFSSNVSLQRLSPVPGFLKTVGGESFLPPSQTIQPDGVYGSKYTDASKTGTPYVGTVARTSIVNWDLRIYNEGGIGSNAMEDYTVIDTVDAPYRFTGNFFYDYYSLDGTKMTSSSVPVFSLGGRSENDTTVMISTGQGSSALTLNGTITVNGDPVPVDGGRATVQLLRDDTGNETIKVRLQDNYHRLPPNTYMSLVAHTQYVSSDAVLSKQFYNHAQVEPSVEFDPPLVSQGHVLYKEDDGDQIPYAIESGASVTMTAGYSSAARKQVTQMGATSNTGWSDRTDNSIKLPDKFSKFYYDLYVDLPEDDPTKKIVLIDALPEVGDHSPFVARDLRESEFKVHITGEDPGFHVWASPNLGSGNKVQLEYSQYTLEVATKHEFEADDWEGAGTGWTAIDLSDGVSTEETELLDAARAFRIVVDDPNMLESPEAAIMGKNYQFQVRFNAELANPSEADPGAIAWNSFGYRYTVPIGATGMMTSLNAEPLKVGVQVPAVPYVIKDQKTPHNHYKSIDTAGTYRFLVYTGTAIESLNDVSEMSAEAIAGVLSDNSRDFTVVSIPIAAGTATGRTDYLDEEKKWELSGTSFAPTGTNWIWENSAKYTILELPWEANGFRFSDIQHSPVNNYTFTQNTANNVVLRVTNVWTDTGKLKLQKTVSGPNFSTDRSFTFTITLKDGRYPAFGAYNYKGTNMRDGTLTFDDTGTASIQLKHGQAIELSGIPAGYTYRVTESEDEWYAQKSAENVTGTIGEGQTSTVSFENERKSSSLTVSKTVSGNMGDKSKQFDFEIYIVDEGHELSGAYQTTIHRANGTDEAVSTPFVDGALVVKLAHGDTVEVTGLPYGARYAVDELAASRKGYKTTSSNDTGTLGDETAASSWTNLKDGMIPTLQDFGMADTLFVLAMAMIATAIVWRRDKRKQSRD